MASKATLTPREVAYLLGVHPNTVYRAIEADGFPVPVIRIGRKLLFSTRAFERLLRSCDGVAVSGRDAVSKDESGNE